MASLLATAGAHPSPRTTTDAGRSCGARPPSVGGSDGGRSSRAREDTSRSPRAGKQGHGEVDQTVRPIDLPARAELLAQLEAERRRVQ